MAISLLLADDSLTIAKILSMALVHEDYAIRSVTTAGDALRELYANPPAVFLVDLQLPEQDGYSFSNLIKNDPALQKTRVCLLSSAFEPADPEKVRACGADAVIVKPFEPAELRKRLRDMRNAPTNFAPPPSLIPTQNIQDPTIQLDTNFVQEDPTISSLMGSALDGQNQAASNDVDSILSGLLNKEDNAAGPLQLELETEEPPPPPEPQRLSANAQALSTFFDAEIASHQAPAGAVAAPTEEETMLDFSAELSAEDIPTPSANILSSWSSPHFDVGGSNFRFSNDYIQRITQSFLGEDKEFQPTQQASFFPHQSSDTQAAFAPEAPIEPAQSPSPFSSLSQEETTKIEQMIREEVHLVCREIVEKVAWEVIPELAENLIQKELQKVLAELER